MFFLNDDETEKFDHKNLDRNINDDLNETSQNLYDHYLEGQNFDY